MMGGSVSQEHRDPPFFGTTSLGLGDTNVEQPPSVLKASMPKVRAGRTFWVVPTGDPV